MTRYVVTRCGDTFYVCDRVYLFDVVASFDSKGNGCSASRSRLLADELAAVLELEHREWSAA